MKSSLFRLAPVTLLLIAVSARAQGPGPPPGGGGPPGGPPPFGRDHPPPPRARIGPPGTWWRDSGLVQRLGLSPDQLSKIDAIFQQSRLRLIDASASLQKQESQLDPLLAEDRPDEARVTAQIDRIAQARAELEKTNARLLLSIRGILTQDQWKRLQIETNRPPGGMRR